ncbi:MAG: fused MFS/spermidine synthase [Chloroflexi bacterium]|nr:fused MFS/spermidine synthase [Chloroflexota bacterium]
MKKDWLWRPSLIVFISNACVMTIELVAGRIIAPWVGVSLYTWTSVIGVILAGMSAGNFIGGKLADRYASRPALGGLFVLGGLASLSVLLTATVFGEQGLGLVPGLPLVARMVLYIGSIFFIPSTVLGMISPLVVKLSLEDLNHAGNTVGQIYAASALGSILGTFATGYYLISWFGTHAIMLGVGIILIVLGLLLSATGRNRLITSTASAVLVAAVFIAPIQPIVQGPCLRETNYFCIRVTEKTLDDKSTVRILALDRLVHSYSSLDNPRKLVYQYEKVAAETTEYLAQRENTLNAFFIGGGGYTFPRYLEAVYPNSSIDVAEIDPGVTQTAYQMLGLSPTTRIVTYNEDARMYLKTMPADKRYNLVLGDAFNDFSVPYHLTTREFNDLLRSHMTLDGIYILNMIDGKPFNFVITFMRTLKLTFNYLYLIPTNKDYAAVDHNTFIILASAQPIDTAKLRTLTGSDNVRDIDQWLLPDSKVTEMLQSGPQYTLSDDFVPVDNLLAPMFEASAATH